MGWAATAPSSRAKYGARSADRDFIYCNNIPSTTTNPVQASQALYADAVAQAAAEATAWPYSWFSNANYTGPSGRGSVTGHLVISDPYSPNASAANMWVGLIQQPVTSTSTYDFQQWMKPYQFWVHTDANGNFTFPTVIAGSNYTLYAFGQGAAGTFMSQAQTGGSPPFLEDVPTTQFSVTVNAGAATALGNVTWTPTRLGPTVFEIGYPDHTSRKFRHGDDYWVGDIGPSVTAPSPVWSKWMEYPNDFPSGPNYTVGTSRWTTDWNFIQPVVYSTTQTWNSSSSTITFNLASAPASGAQAQLYLGLASDYYTALIISVNGTNLGGSKGPITNVTATPSTLVSTGFVPGYTGSDGSIREYNNGAFSDERITLPGTLLKAGANTITISQRQVGGTYFADHAMYDYVRLELTGYVPPAPASISAYAGNNSTLVTWPIVAGATSYKLLRTTTSGSSYTTVASGITGPVSGSGPTNVTYVDNTAANGTTYYYVVESNNPVSSSANSPESTSVTPSAVSATSSPSTPTGLTATAGNKSVALSWTAPSGANLYTVKRSTLTDNGGGTYNTLGTITLTNGVTGTNYTDSSPTNGSIYTYTVSATNAAGTSSDSTATSNTTPVATAPTTAPTVTATALQGSSAGGITLNWSAISGATGYVVQRATSSSGSYTFLYTLASLTTTDTGLTANTTYYYQVATMNSGGTSAFVTVNATTPPAAPATVTATGGSAKVTLSWTAATGATSYVIGRSTTSGGTYTTIASAATGTSYVDTTAINGVTYYYVIASTGTGGTGVNSTEVSAAPVGVTTLTWTGASSTAWDTTTSNWNNGTTATTYLDGNDVVFADSPTTSTVVISASVAPDYVYFTNATTTYTFSSSAITGSAGILKTGAGTVTFNNVNSITGTTIISGGTVAIGVTSSTSGALGTGVIQLNDGATFKMADTGGHNFPSNAIQVSASASATLASAALSNGYTGNISGPSTGTLTLSGPVSFSVSGTAQLSGFSGLVIIPSGSQLRFSSTSGANGNGSANATFQVNGTLNTRNSAGSGGVVLGGLSGSGTVSGQTNTTTGSTNFFVGANNLDTTFSGGIANGSNGTALLTKNGTGTLTLSGSNSYTGATTVNAGTLKITGSLTATASVTTASGGTLSLSGGTITSGVTIQSGGTLTGNGTITGNLSNAGTVSCGTGSNLVVNGNITNTGFMQFTAGSGVQCSGTFGNSGILDVTTGLQTLPSNFTNTGTVYDSSSIKVQQIAQAGSIIQFDLFTLQGHNYQLQRTSTLSFAHLEQYRERRRREQQHPDADRLQRRRDSILLPHRGRSVSNRLAVVKNHRHSNFPTGHGGKTCENPRSPSPNRDGNGIFMKIYPTEWQKKTMWAALTAFSIVTIGAISVGLILLAKYVIAFLQPLLLPFGIAGVLAYLLEPPVRWLEKLKLSRTSSVLIVFGFFLVFGTLILVWLIPVVSDQASKFVQSIPELVTKTQKFVIAMMDRYEQKFETNPYVQEGIAWLQQQVPAYVAKVWEFIRGSFGGALGILGFLLGLVITPLYLFYFLKETAFIRDRWADYLPLQNSRFKDEVVATLIEINGYLIAFFRGQLLVSIINGVLVGIGLLSMGLSSGLLIGLAVCVMGLIPYLGILLCWIPAVIIAAVQFGDWQHPLAVTGIFLLVNQMEGWLISPKIVGESVGLHPLTVMASVVGWSLLLGGLLGAILAVPLTATAKVILRRYVWKRVPSSQKPLPQPAH
ncbi:MAG: AI-2E family transporter [Chthoniobacteraceae bacterium]